MKVQVIIGWRSSGDPYREQALTAVLDHLGNQPGGVLLVDSDSAVFSRAGAFNRGAALSDADVLLLHNPDVIIPHRQLNEAVMLAYEYRVTVYPFTRYKELTRDATTAYLAGDMTARELQLKMGPECVGPALAIRRDLYQEWGGMDERFEGWGFEDIAWSLTSMALLGRHRRVPGDCIHLWHPPMPHSSKRPTALTEQNRELCDRYVAADREGIIGLLHERDLERVGVGAPRLPRGDA